MGIWGIDILENDIACDVRETYERYLIELEDEQAYLKIFEENLELIGTEDEPFFWYALALSQWENGRLNQEVKKKALEFIAINGGFSKFRTNLHIQKRWKKNLHNLQQTLLAPMPPRKIIKTPKKLLQNPWNVGDIYAYKFHNRLSQKSGQAGKYIGIQKVGDVEYYKGVVFSVVQVFDGIFDHVPCISEIKDLRILPLIDPPGIDGTPNLLSMYVPSFEYYLKATMILDRQEDYPQEYLTFIGNHAVINAELNEYSFSDLFWTKDNMDDWLIQFHINWKNRIY